jgi:hypothetical protein
MYSTFCNELYLELNYCDDVTRIVTYLYLYLIRNLFFIQLVTIFFVKCQEVFVHMQVFILVLILI